METLRDNKHVMSKPDILNEGSFTDLISRIIKNQAKHFKCKDDDLLKIVHDIATAKDSPEISPRGIRPINYLANASASGILTLAEGRQVIGIQTPQAKEASKSEIFDGVNSEVLRPLAETKHSGALLPLTDSKLRGFGLSTPLGLSFLLSPWTDFCLLCWDYYDRTAADDSGVTPSRSSRLILGKDYYPLSHEAVFSQQFDWPVNGMMDCNLGNKKFWNFYGVPPSHVPHHNPSTKKLFDALTKAAFHSTDGKLSMEQWIGRERILVYNVWPWFRSGTSTIGSHGIHGYFNKVPCLVEWLCRIIDIIKPAKIAALGEWSYETENQNPDDWLRKNMLNLATHRVPDVDVFYHPSARDWTRPWRGRRWTATWRANKDTTVRDAFVDFIS